MLEVMNVRLTSDSMGNIPAGIRSSVSIVIQNNDSVALPMGDSIHFSISVNGTYLYRTMVMTAGLDTTEQFEYNFGDSNLILFGQTVDTFDAVGIVIVYGDSGMNIDTTILPYRTSTTVYNDWIGSDIDIMSPSNLNGFNLDNGTNIPPPISEVEVLLTNTGAVTYLQYTPIQYRVYMGGEDYSIEGILEDGDVGLGESTTRSVTNQALLPSTPNAVGTYTLCMAVDINSDNNNGNDESCTDFTIVDNYDPTDPNNWPHAVEETPVIEATVRASGTNVLIENITEPIQTTLIDLSGKVIRSETFARDTRVDMSSYASGLYFVKLEQGDLEPAFHKVIIP